MKWTEIATDVQEHYALPQILKKKKVKFQAGRGISRNIMLDHSNAAEHVGLYATDNVNVGDVMTTINIPWRNTTTHYAFDLHEVSMNSGKEEIVDLISVRRTDAMISLAELMEETMWGTISDDGVTPFCFQYWIDWEDDSTGGFGGLNHSSFSSGPGGLSASTYSRWRNWCSTYTNVSKDASTDLIPQWRKAFRECGWKPAIQGIPTYDKGRPRYENFVNGDTIQAIEDLGEDQNENLGRDIASMDGQMMFRRTPIHWVPYLDDYTTSDPVWMVDWSVFHPVFLKGWYLKESKPEQAPNQHNVMRVFVDLTWNMLCVNRRKLAVLAKADPASGV